MSPFVNFPAVERFKDLSYRIISNNISLSPSTNYYYTTSKKINTQHCNNTLVRQ